MRQQATYSRIRVQKWELQIDISSKSMHVVGVCNNWVTMNWIDGWVCTHEGWKGHRVNLSTSPSIWGREGMWRVWNCDLTLWLAGAAAAAKKWIDLINIHDLDCTMLHVRIMEHVADVTGTLTAAAPSIRTRTRPYCAARMLNQLRCGHRAWPCSS